MSKKSDRKKESEKFKPVLTCMVAASILLVAAFSAIDFNGSYADYRKAHEEVPALLASAAAVSENVFPWTTLTAYAAIDPTATGDGSEGGQGRDAAVVETQPEPQPVETKAPEAETGSAEEPNRPSETKAAAETKAAKDSTKAAEETKTASETKSTAGIKSKDMANDSSVASGETKKFTTVDMSYFGDAAFVGDSFTQGLMLYADIPGADFLCYQSKNTYDIMDSQIQLKSGRNSTVRSELSNKQYGKIYIMLGINELSNDTSGFVQRYQKVINQIHDLQPNAVIFVQSIMHTTPSKSAKTNFKNSIIDANNEALATLADNKTVFYIDVNPPFDDGTGALRSDYSGDGVHLKASHYKEWRDYLLNFGIK